MKANKITTEVRTDKLGRRSTWYLLADGRAFRSERQALAAKPLKVSKARRAATKSKIAAAVAPAPVAEVMTAAQLDVFTVLAHRTIGDFDYSRAMYRYMAGNRSEQTIRTLGTQWQYAMQDVAQAAMEN